MSSLQRKLNRRHFKEAEGYLELATLFEDQYPLPEQQRVDLALRCAEALDQIKDPGTRETRVQYLYGQAMRLAQRYSEAIESLEKSFELDTSNIHTCLALAWCYKRNDQIDKAVEAMREALTLEPESGIVHYNLACYLAITANANEAVKHLAVAIDIDDAFRDLAVGEADFDTIRTLSLIHI